jgi:hypothetical protein
MEAAVYCPNCGRYIGPVEKCPYCRQKVMRPALYKCIKYGALAFAVLGLIMLHQFAIFTGTQKLKVADITMTHNYAFIQIEGDITETPIYFATGKEPDSYGSLYFEVDDGTGTATVKCYSGGTTSLVKADTNTNPKVPAFGDYAIIKCQIQYRGREFSLILNDAAQIEILREHPKNITISQIFEFPKDNTHDGLRVCITGRYAEFIQYKYAIGLIIEENGNEIEIYIPNSVTHLFGWGDIKKYSIGMQLEIKGALNYYPVGIEGRWQVIPAKPTDIRLV